MSKFEGVGTGGNPSWPIPFGGIQYSIKFNTYEALKEVVDSLMKEATAERPHYHNFAVQVDGYMLHTSENALDCMRRIYGA